MRLFLLSTVSTAALVAAAMPASAGDNMTGVAGASVGVGTVGGSPTLDDPTVYGVNGKGYWTLSPDVHLQADLFYQNSNNLVIDSWSNDNAAQVGGALHLVHPLDTRARVGFAGSIWNTDYYNLANSSTYDNTFGLAAVEGQFFGADWTVTGQAGFFSSIDCSLGAGSCFDTLDSGTFVRGNVRYFLYDNTSATLATTQMWGKISGGDFFDQKSLDSSQWNLEVEHKFEGSQFSGLITFEHQRDVSNVVDFQTTSDTNIISLGVKFYLDQPTLRSNDRTGAALDTPTFGNAASTYGPLSVGGT